MSDEKSTTETPAPAPAQAPSQFALTVQRAANLDPAIWNAERIAVVKRTVAPESAGPAELAMFLAVCGRYGLDPFAKEAWLVDDRGRLIIVTGRDAIVKVARRDEKYAGMEADVVFSNDTFRAVRKDGSVRVEHAIEGWDRGDLVGAYCVVHKDGQPSQLIMRTLEDYKHLENKQNWKNYPQDMLLSRVITAAHRLMYNISGMYTPEEIEGGEAEQTLQSHEVAAKTRERLDALKSDLANGNGRVVDADFEVVDEGKKGEPAAAAAPEKPAPKARAPRSSKPKAEPARPAEPAAAAAPAETQPDDAEERARANARFWVLYGEKGYDRDVVEQEESRYAWLQEHFGKRSFGQLSLFEIRTAIELLEKGEGPAKPAAAAAAAGNGDMPA